MVFRSIWQGLQQPWARSEAPGTETTGLSDVELKAQAIQDEKQSQNLIAIEKARGSMKLRLVLAIGGLGLIALIVLVVALVVTVRAAAHLKLPWHPIATVVCTLLGSSGVSGLVGWQVRKRILTRPQAAARSENPQAGDPDQVGTT
ncbi:hypothetical protein [Streptomyces longisporus]|uniref:Phage holin family protein n=1 Tax=Streptomyces longisporus TaxID=1948 RepID=A0ABN3M557_STRLO